MPKLVLIAAALLFAPNIVAQTQRVKITLTPPDWDHLRIEGESAASDAWSFRNSYAGILRLGERIENFRATAKTGESIAVQQLAPGEFRSASKANRFSYDVRLGAPSHPAEMSHVSWLTPERGFLMLTDLLPEAGSASSQSTLVEFSLPSGWTVGSAIQPDENQKYLTSDIDKTVFLVGFRLVRIEKRINSLDFAIVTSGEWPFPNIEVMDIAEKLLKQHSRLTGYKLHGRAALMLASFPERVGPERWSAETRGVNVVLLLGRYATREALLARIGIVLTHELFHLWVPNALALQGDYDWFFEGFTLYEALRIAQRVGLIRFEDYLATIARVYDSYLSSPDHDQLSLIEASERRWTTSPSLIYDKGMLVAFIYDLMVRHVSENKSSLDDVYRQLFVPQPGGRGNANEVIISILARHRGMNQFSQQYVTGASAIDLESVLQPYGLKVQSAARTEIHVSDELNKRQRKLLRSFGYKQ